jgi:Protein of unknown function (DUF3363)
MARDDNEKFRVRPGRSRNRGPRINPRTQPFLKQVQIAVRKAGGDPRRIGSGARSGGGQEGERTGRFNARGRGAKVVASFARQGGDGGWQRDSAGRFRARRVVVKARVIRLNPQVKGSRGPKMRRTMSRAVDAHLRYLERDGVTRDGERGKAYSALENEADSKAFVDRGLTYVPANASEYVSGRLAGVASLVSGRFAMIDNGLGFQLVPWQPLLEKRIGQHIIGLQRDDGGIEWTLGRNRGLSL